MSPHGDRPTVSGFHHLISPIITPGV
jgi:hypothetical protein